MMDKVHNLADVTAPGSDLASLPPHLAPILLQGAPDTTSAFGQLLVCLMSEVQFCSSTHLSSLFWLHPIEQRSFNDSSYFRILYSIGMLKQNSVLRSDSG